MVRHSGLNEVFQDTAYNTEQSLPDYGPPDPDSIN